MRRGTQGGDTPKEHASMGNKEQHPKKEVKKPKKDKKK